MGCGAVSHGQSTANPQLVHVVPQQVDEPPVECEPPVDEPLVMCGQRSLQALDPEMDVFEPDFQELLRLHVVLVPTDSPKRCVFRKEDMDALRKGRVSDFVKLLHEFGCHTKSK